MTKQGSTKDRILKLISEGDNNLSTISELLKLAPSTVSKHLHDLETSGTIVQKDNPHVKKWKYYQLSSEATAGNTKNERFATVGNFAKAATFVALLAVLTFAAFLHFQNNTSKTVYIPVSITDPPQVPSGTQALYINYSSLSVHLSYKGNSEWVPVNASGRLDLMSLINESQVLGRVEIKPNSTVDIVEFNITSASVTVDNITYAVHTIGNRVTAKVDNKAVNESSNILLDFSPVVTPMYSQESTSFVLMPSLRAAVVPNPKLTMQPLPASDDAHARYPVPHYKDIFPSATTNLTIENAALHSYGNDTSLSITVLNGGKSNATVIGILLYGNETISAMPEMAIINGTAIINTSNFRTAPPDVNGIPINGNMHIGANVWATPKLFQQKNSSFSINASGIREVGSYLGVNSIRIRLADGSGNILLYNIGASSAQNMFLGGMHYANGASVSMRSPGINFLVNENGTLFLPSPRLIPPPASKHGYLLPPKSSATFSYNGVVRIMEDGLPITLPSGGVYRIVVVTDEGITQANLTST